MKTATDQTSDISDMRESEVIALRRQVKRLTEDNRWLREALENRDRPREIARVAVAEFRANNGRQR